MTCRRQHNKHQCNLSCESLPVLHAASKQTCDNFYLSDVWFQSFINLSFVLLPGDVASKPSSSWSKFLPVKSCGSSSSSDECDEKVQMNAGHKLKETSRTVNIPKNRLCGQRNDRTVARARVKCIESSVLKDRDVNKRAAPVMETNSVKVPRFQHSSFSATSLGLAARCKSSSKWSSYARNSPERVSSDSEWSIKLHLKFFNVILLRLSVVDEVLQVQSTDRTL